MPRAPTELIDRNVPWNRLVDGVSTSGVFTNVWATFQRSPSYRFYNGSTTPGYATIGNRRKKRLPTLAHNVLIIRDSGVNYNSRKVVLSPLGAVVSSDDYTIENSYIVGSAPGSVSHLSEAAFRARAKLADRINGMSINLAQAMGERHQTASLLVTSAQRIAHAALALKRARLGDFVTALSMQGRAPSAKQWQRVIDTPKSKRIANHWLEYQYGWKPLMSDAYGAAELLATHVRDDPSHAAARGSSQRTEDLYYHTRDSGSVLQIQDTTTTTTKYGVRFRLDSAARAMLSRTGISNPALLAWELLPYSFVVDWFIPVGNYLQALDAFSGFDFVDGFQLNFSKRSYVYNYTPTSDRTWNGVGWSTLIAPKYSSRTIVKLDRAPLASWPVATPPRFKNPIGGEPLARFATAAALLRVLFK